MKHARLLALVVLAPMLTAGCDNLCPPYGNNPDCQYAKGGEDGSGDGDSPSPVEIAGTPCQMVAQLYSRQLTYSSGESWPAGPHFGGFSWINDDWDSGWESWGGQDVGDSAAVWSPEAWKIGDTPLFVDIECPECPPIVPSDVFVWALVTDSVAGAYASGSAGLTSELTTNDYPLDGTQLSDYGWWLMAADVSNQGDWEWPAVVSWTWPTTVLAMGRVGEEGDGTVGAPLSEPYQESLDFIPAAGACMLAEEGAGVDGSGDG